jgi:hypothetical protein
MSYHFEVEEQAYNPKMLNAPPDLIPKYLTPIAPVTLALQWSPFPMATTLHRECEVARPYGNPGPSRRRRTPQAQDKSQKHDRSNDNLPFRFDVRVFSSELNRWHACRHAKQSIMKPVVSLRSTTGYMLSSLRDGVMPRVNRLAASVVANPFSSSRRRHRRPVNASRLAPCALRLELLRRQQLP